MEIAKLTTVNIKNLTREELEAAYKDLLRVSKMKTDLIESLRAEIKSPTVEEKTKRIE